MIAVIVSRKDEASLNIHEELVKLKVDNIHVIDELHIHSEDIDKKINAGLFIFASKHSSSSGVSSLSMHFPGNWGDADLGGEERTLSVAAPLYMREAFSMLNELNNISTTTLEVTHHGPKCNKPCFFIEIGSSLEQWKDKKLGSLIAKTIQQVIKKEPKKREVALGIGGPHYCNNFNKIMIETDIALSHICSKHMLQFLDREMLEQAIRKSEPQPTFAIIDWKGLGEHKEKVIKLLEEVNFPYKKTKQF